MNNLHSFHIPVMGLAFTIDTPIKVAHLGISSVISLGDDFLIEKALMFYSNKYSIPIGKIDRKEKETRTNIITYYLDLIDEIVDINWNLHINNLIEDDNYRNEFFDLLPDDTFWKNKWKNSIMNLPKKQKVEFCKINFTKGGIDVNIMTKVDKKNYLNGEELPIQFNDAHAAICGFVNSKLKSSVVLSAGMSPALFNFMQKFDEFLPNCDGKLLKKITVKVSDYRSALIQGKMLAKKGLWVSEIRIESGLNCGGHAFPTNGNLLGPILEEFKQRRNEIYEELYSIYNSTLKASGKFVNNFFPRMKISAQGGVGTNQEHNFLLKNYALDSVGWGSPFLLVPEAVSIDNITLQMLSCAREDDIYLSDASPLGIPFNNLKNSTRQQHQNQKVLANKAGSPCTKKFLKMNTEFGDEGLCTASREYIKNAIDLLEKSKLSATVQEKEKQKLYEKECLCCGLSMPFMVEHNLSHRMEGHGVSVCPGPNLAYFEGIFSLKDMIKHIYGRKNLISRTDRPNVFIKEIQLYMDYLAKQLLKYNELREIKMKNNLSQFIENMQSSIKYYKEQFLEESDFTKNIELFQVQLNEFYSKLSTNKFELLNS